MFSSFGDFFNSVKYAEFSFTEIWKAIVSLYYDITKNSDISAIWNGLMDAISPIYATIATLAVVFCVIVSLYGSKIMGFLKFSSFFVIGFALGVHLLAPIIPETVIIPPWIVGIVTALVSAVLYRFLYVVLLSVAVGYGTYLLLYNGFYLQAEPTHSPTKAFICLVIAFAVVLVAFLFKKYIEITLTAAVGGWCASWLFANEIYAFSSNWIVIIIPAVLIAAGGFILQMRTRYRY